VFLSLSPCAENTEEEDVKCKARCREKETKGFKTKPEIWVVTFATGPEENERFDIDLQEEKNKKQNSFVSSTYRKNPNPFFLHIHKNTKQTHTHTHTHTHT
jgi:hypothetical protein